MAKIKLTKNIPACNFPMRINLFKKPGDKRSVSSVVLVLDAEGQIKREGEEPKRKEPSA